MSGAIKEVSEIEATNITSLGSKELKLEMEKRIRAEIANSLPIEFDTFSIIILDIAPSKFTYKIANY
jgi:hypothetical protein